MDINIEHIVKVSQKAGDKILEIYNDKKNDFQVVDKSDGSPLTLADKASHNLIVSFLEKKYPNIPVLSEESEQTKYDVRKNWKVFWLIDPLDGTKEFIKRNGEFTINIALIKNNKPYLGVVHVPVKNKTYFTAGNGTGSFVRDGNGNDKKIYNKVHYLTLDKIKMVASRSHMSEEVLSLKKSLENKGKKVELTQSGSSLKLCIVAEGIAHLYPRYAPTMEWDTAAAHAIVNESGRKVLEFNSDQELKYNKKNLLNPWFSVE